MTGYLQFLGGFVNRLIIGPEEAQLRNATPAQVEGMSLVGHYSLVAGERVLFYRWHGELRLRFGEASSISLQGAIADWSCHAGLVSFKLKIRDQTIISRSYPVSDRIAALDEDPTPFVEAEDFDVLLLVCNVLADSARASRIYAEE